MLLGTKAETLKRLYGKLENATVLDVYAFTVDEWNTSAEQIWEKVKKIQTENFIVRSSALNEDTALASQAGKYESVANVVGREAFIEAVNQVIASYDDDNDKNQVLVQPMLSDVHICGEVLWRTTRTYAKMYMTDLLQGLIDENYRLKAVHINRGWFEIDDCDDLKVVESQLR